MTNIKSMTSHWAAVAFALAPGKKILDYSMYNAKNKESIADVLAILSKAEIYYGTVFVGDIDYLLDEGSRSIYGPDHGRTISKHLRETSQKGMKVLKGEDREKLITVQRTGKNAVYMIVLQHLINDLIPYFKELEAAINNKEPFSKWFLDDDMAIMFLEDGCGHGEEALLDQLKDFSTFVYEVATQICGDESLPHKDASSLPTLWSTKSKAMVAALAACVDRAERNKCFSEGRLQEHMNLVKTQMTAVGEAIEKSLQGQLREGSMTNVTDCLKTMMVAVHQTESQCVDEDVKTDFFQKVEAAQLVSTILGDEGHKVSAGVHAASLLFGCVCARAQVIRGGADGDGDSEKRKKSLDFIKSYSEMMALDVGCILAVKELNDIVSVLSAEDVACVEALMQNLTNLHDQEFDQTVKDCNQRLDACYVEEKLVELPQFVLNLENHSDIDEAKVKTAFSMQLTTDISAKAVALESAVVDAKATAGQMGKDASAVFNIMKYQTAYSSAIRWLATGNILHALLSRAVRRAVLTNTRPHQKAMNVLGSASKAASDHDVEIPAGLQAVVSKVANPQGGAADGDAQTSHAVP